MLFVGAAAPVSKAVLHMLLGSAAPMTHLGVGELAKSPFEMGKICGKNEEKWQINGGIRVSDQINLNYYPKLDQT